MMANTNVGFKATLDRLSVNEKNKISRTVK